MDHRHTNYILDVMRFKVPDMKLTLSMKKTHFIVFKAAKKHISSSKSVLINNLPITQFTTTKFLGIIIDSSLSWRDHILTIKGKASWRIGILSKARCYFNYVTRKTLYYSFIYPYLHYCHEIWGSTYATYLDPLIKLQKRAMRVITGSPILVQHAEPCEHEEWSVARPLLIHAGFWLIDRGKARCISRCLTA